MPAHFARGIEISLTERGTAAAFPVLHERDAKAERFQNFHRRDPDVRLVVTHESVVPENDFAALGRGGALRRPDAAARRPYLMFAKPPIEALPGVMRQRPLVG